MSFCTDN